MSSTMTPRTRQSTVLESCSLVEHILDIDALTNRELGGWYIVTHATPIQIYIYILNADRAIRWHLPDPNIFWPANMLAPTWPRCKLNGHYVFTITTPVYIDRAMYHAASILPDGANMCAITRYKYTLGRQHACNPRVPICILSMLRRQSTPMLQYDRLIHVWSILYCQGRALLPLTEHIES